MGSAPNYLYVLGKAVKIFGGENVRSNIIVGLEPYEDTIKAVKCLIDTKVQPCLSPYEPYKQLPEIRKPTWQMLYKVYKATEDLCVRSRIKIAPSIYAADTHNSVASAINIPLIQTEYDAFYNNVYSLNESVEKELRYDKNIKMHN